MLSLHEWINPPKYVGYRRDGWLVTVTVDIDGIRYEYLYDADHFKKLLDIWKYKPGAAFNMLKKYDKKIKKHGY